MQSEEGVNLKQHPKGKVGFGDHDIQRKNKGRLLEKDKGKLLYVHNLKYVKLGAIIYFLFLFLFLILSEIPFLYYHIKIGSILGIVGGFLALIVILIGMPMAIIGYRWSSYDIYENGIMNPAPIWDNIKQSVREKGIFYHFDDIAQIYKAQKTMIIIEDKDGNKYPCSIGLEKIDEVVEIALNTQKRYFEMKVEPEKS